MRALATLDRMHECELHVERQRGGDSVRIDFVRREAFGLQEDLVARAIGETHDLVLDRRAIARADAFDDAGEKRRAIEAPADDLVRVLVRVRDPARQLPRMHCAVADETEDGRRIVPWLRLERREVDRATVEARRRSSLQAAGRQLQLAQARAQRLRRRVARPSRLVVLQADVDQPGEERPGGQYDRIGLEGETDLGDDPCDTRPGAIAVDRQVVDGLLEQSEVRLVLQSAADRRLVENPIGLRSSRPHCGTLARVERSKLDPCFVRGNGHRAPQRVDLLHQMSLANAADRRIAGHLPQRLDAVREQQRLAAHPCAGERGLGACVATTNDYHLISRTEQHDFTGVFVRWRTLAAHANISSHHTAKRRERGTELSADAMRWRTSNRARMFHVEP